MKNISLQITIICLIHRLALSITLKDTQLEHVQIVHRHCDRTPIVKKPYDTFTDSAWEKYGGYGQLTQAGIRTCHKFGVFIRQFYSDFIPEAYNRNSAHIISTDFDRTIMSAQSILSGVFPPEQYQVWNKNVRWQPVPVHMTPKEGDKIFNLNKCLKYSRLLNETYISDGFLKLTRENQDLIDKINKGIGNGNLSLIDFETLADNLFIAKENEMSPPEWLTSSMYRRIRSIGTGLYNFYFRTTEMARLISGSILFQMRKNIIEKTKEKSTNRLYMFSAHDSFLSALIKLLDIGSELRQPNYGAAVVIELRRSLKGDGMFVRALLKDNPSSQEIEMNEVNMLGQTGSGLMPLETFLSLIENRVVEDNEHECKLGAKQGSILIEYALIITCIAVGLFFSITGLGIYKLNKLRSRRHFVMDLGENVNLMISDDEIYSNTDQVVFNKETMQ